MILISVLDSLRFFQMLISKNRAMRKILYINIFIFKKEKIERIKKS